MKRKIFLIAEAGVNHNGNMVMAKKLIDVAKWAGADAVKFQTFSPEEITTKQMGKANYQSKNYKKYKTQIQMLKKLVISKKNHKVLSRYCKKKKIEFLSTGFDIENLKMLISLGIKRIKIPSGEITNLPLLQFISNQKIPIILSTGMSNLSEIGIALKILTKNKISKNKITILHCTSLYPAPFETVNLKALETIKKKFKTSIGYSDHTLGTEVSIAAASLGSSVIEKHFTLNRNLVGPDHKSSLEPGELKKMFLSIRNIEQAMGNGKKIPTQKEIYQKNFFRRSIVAAKNIKIGDRLSLSNITIKRAGQGISALKLKKIIGKISRRNFKKDQLIKI
tara:strand:- start:22315 stop:23322 length:1008 start_codon:yes stop_codon:yes gene_type:complete